MFFFGVLVLTIIPLPEPDAINFLCCRVKIVRELEFLIFRVRQCTGYPNSYIVIE